MSQQNPWKKQMMMNKVQNNVSDTNSSSISQFPKQDKITPQWMKKNEQAANSSGVNSNQSSWIKNKQPGTASQPVWMKNNTQQTQSQNNSTTPTWMQNKNNYQQNNVPAWKAGGTMFGADKKKKQEQERLKKQQQQKQRLQRQQQQRRQAELQRQRENEKRQQQKMKSQEEDSRRRQMHDLEREKQIKKKFQEQQQRKRLQEQEMNNKKFQESQKVKLASSSKRRLGQSLKIAPLPQSPVYLRFLHYYSQSINPGLQYKQKITQQKQLLKICKEFSHQMKQQIVQLVRRKVQGDAKVLSQDKKNKIVNMERINTQVYYALCEGQQREAQLVNGIERHQQSIKFDMSSIQRFQKIFNFYNLLIDIFCTISKKHPSSITTKFRVPLLTLIQYKGIAFLCEAYTTEILSTQSVLSSECKEITNELGIIEKELKQKYHCQLGKNDLMIKKVHIHEIQQELYIFYLKNWDIKMSSNSQIGSRASIQQLTTDYCFLSQCDNMKRVSLIPEVEFQTFRKVKTESFVELAEVVQLSQCIFVVYSSCQGEVEEKQFWELIMSESEEIWALIRSAGFKGKLHKNKRFLFQIFEALSGVKIRCETKKSSKQQKLTIKQSKCMVSNYDFTKMEINEIVKNFEKYLKENKLELAQHSLAIMKELQCLSEQKEMLQPQVNNDENQQVFEQLSTDISQLSIKYTIKLSKYLVAKSKSSTATKILQKLLSNKSKFKNNSYANIPIKMELLFLYIKLKKETKILEVFKELLQVVEFYYGPQGLINAALYQMLASYYSFAVKSAENSSNLQAHVITLYEHATSILIKFYGDQSQSVADLYLSRAVSFLNMKNYDFFNRDIEHALKIFRSHSRQKQKIAQCLFYKGRERIENELVSNKSEGVQLIEQSATIFIKLCNYAEAMDSFLLVIEMLDEKKEQNLKKIQALTNLVVETLIQSFKSVKHISKAIKIIIRKFNPQIFVLIQKHQILKKEEQNEKINEHQDSEQQKNHEKIFLDFQDLLKGFQNFTEMIKWLNWNSISLEHSQMYPNPSKERFNQILQILSYFVSLKETNEAEEDMPEEQSEDKNEKNSQSSFSHDQQSESNSPIKKISKKSSMKSNPLQSYQFNE